LSQDDPSSGVVARLNTALEGRYRIERELGQGGMATVYLAADLKHDRKVALKVLKPELAAVLGAERFVVEIKTTAALQHPHILPLFDSGTADGFLYYVMPFIDGETLRGKLDRETQLGVDEAVRIASDVASALHYAHTHGVIHRDIKPENILLHDGRPMVADFGIALAVSAAAGGRMTETGLSLGTPHYMSPEQATAEKEITARSDVYSLGSVLYEMLAGQPPHLGGSAQQIIMKIITETAQDVTVLRKSVPPNVAAAVGKALEKLPADRFESAKAFAEALANPAFGAMPGASASRGVRAGAGAGSPWLKRAALLVVGGLVLGVAGAKLFWRAPAPDVVTRRLLMEFAAGEHPVRSTGGGAILAQPPDGGSLLYSGPGTNTRTQYWVRRWDRLSATRLAQTLDDGCCASFSPTGDSLVYLSPPHLLQVVPLSGGVSTTAADSGLGASTEYGGGTSWGSDGMLYASGLNGLVRVSPRGGALEPVTTLDAQRGDAGHLFPSVLPDARGALVTVVPIQDGVNLQRHSIGVADFRTGKVEILLQGVQAIYAPTGHVIFAKANGVLWAAPFDARTRRLTGREVELADTIGDPSLSLSRNGTLTYVKAVRRAEQAVWVDRQGSATPVNGGLASGASDIPNDDLSSSGLENPSISPDGRRLAISMSGADGKVHIWVKPLAGGPNARLTFDGGVNRSVVWRPGSNALTYTSDRADVGGALRIYERDASGAGGIMERAVPDPRKVADVTWSPDGKWMVFRTDDQTAGNADILAIRPGVDTVARALVATPAEEISPSVSYDNRWIAYSSTISGRREVYVSPFPETGSAKYQISSAGGTNPAWNRNGRELFFLDGEGNMVSVPITPGATFQPGQPRVLFAASKYTANPFRRGYDVSPDGQRFVMIRGDNDTAVHVAVVFGFLEELKRVMGTP
jgi:tRNA A-37 threonylcarbamoyl transferase component Bud32